MDFNLLFYYIFIGILVGGFALRHLIYLPRRDGRLS